MTRCSLDLSGQKTNFSPWILVLIINSTLICFHVGFIEPDFLKELPWEISVLFGQREPELAADSSTIISRKCTHTSILIGVF